MAQRSTGEKGTVTFFLCSQSLTQPLSSTMLTVTHPEILPELASLPFGLWPIRIPNEEGLVLIIKCQKEMILTAKIRAGFRFYLTPLNAHGTHTFGLITAFFDDHDEPLTIRSPLFANDEMTTDICEILSSDRFAVHFFDEHNRELLGYRAHNEGADRFRSLLNVIRFVPFSFELARQFHDRMLTWFSRRVSDDDDDALSICLVEALFPDDLYIMDARPQVTSYHGSKSPMHTMLERPESGHFSELDIIKALLLTFASDQIYLNPIRPGNGREFVDVLVATSNNLLLIQAKDSPNTRQILQRSIERKKATIASHLEKAVRQLHGAISYTRSCIPLQIVTGNVLHNIVFKNHNVIGLIIVKELFNSEFSLYSSLAFELFDSTGVPCFILDYPEFHTYTLHRQTEGSFTETLDQVFVAARERGEFPRVRFGLINAPDKN